MKTRMYMHTQFYDCSNLTFEAPCLAITADNGQFIDSITYYGGRLKLYGIPSFFEPEVLARSRKFGKRLEHFKEAGYTLDEIVKSLAEFSVR